MWEYSEKLKDHFLHPRNVGEIENPDAVGEVGNIVCGDALRLTLRIDKDERIVDARFKTFGCASAIASSSVLTEMIKGLTIEEASKITNKDIVKYLGGMPEEKMHCSVMGREALEAAIKNYRGIKLEKQEEEGGKIVCKCFGVTDKKIERVVRENNLTSIEEVTNYCKAGGGCKSCWPEIQNIINKVWLDKGKQPEKKEKPLQSKKLTNIQKIALIEETIDREIRPELKKDGGDIELIDVEGNKVLVALRGMCSGCPSSGFTLKKFVEARLKEFVGEDFDVQEVSE